MSSTSTPAVCFQRRGSRMNSCATRSEWPRDNNPLKRAPHTAAAVSADTWDRPSRRELAAYPAPWLREHKFWPNVARIDNVYGDRNLICSCLPMEAYAP